MSLAIFLLSLWKIGERKENRITSLGFNFFLLTRQKCTKVENLFNYRLI